jgi:hypothetical protein
VLIIFYAVAPIGAFALILGTAILWDRVREPRRDPSRPLAVVDDRTYHDAQRRIQRLLTTGDTAHAQNLIHANLRVAALRGQNRPHVSAHPTRRGPGTMEVAPAATNCRLNGVSTSDCRMLLRSGFDS